MDLGGARLIPARAGSTTGRRARRAPTRAHPRSRGEHVWREFKTLRPKGSSPLARGAPGVDVVSGVHAGLIPARAGSTRLRRACPRSHGAHPRSRGEHFSIRRSSDSDWGSSPLARGAHHRVGGDGARCGLIPARAGSTTWRCTPSSSGPAHPRSRGEHGRSRKSMRASGGSSPLARGAPQDQRHPQAHGRLIPARAGSTQTSWSRPSPSGAHPRSRGEHAALITPLIVAAGSSPLARGALLRGPYQAGGGGLIPARAGSTRGPPGTRCRSWAHPRSRGEHCFVAPIKPGAAGSSPLARGALDACVAAGLVLRLIPARAGSTWGPAPRTRP